MDAKLDNKNHCRQPRQDNVTRDSSVDPNRSLPPAIILDGDFNAVSVARSLAALGVKVYVINKPEASVTYSRFATDIPLPTAEDFATAWTDFLIGPKSDYLRGAVLLAAGDAGLEIIAKHRGLLDKKFRLDASDPQAQLCMLNKLCTYRAAADANVSTPRFWAVNTLDELPELEDSLVFPLIIKPQLSHIFLERFREKFIVVQSFSELCESLLSVSDADVLLVEQIPSDDDKSLSYYTYITEDGTPLFDFCRRLVRRFPPGKGIGTCQFSTQCDPEVRELALKLLRHVGLQGLANVEFLQDGRDGQYKLVECNARFTAPNEMLIRAGVDLAKLVYCRIIGLPTEPITTYKPGVCIWRPVEDVRAFFALRRQGKITLRQWLASVCRPQTLPLFRWQDPWPSAMYALRQFRKLAHVFNPKHELVAHPRQAPITHRIDQRHNPHRKGLGTVETHDSRRTSDHSRMVASPSHYVHPDRLTEFAQALFTAAGVSQTKSTIIAHSLVAANLRGHDSHGVMRIPSYVAKIRNGDVNPAAVFNIKKESPAVLMADGDWGFGQVQCRTLSQHVIEKCRSTGFATGTLIRSTHVGRLGEYCEMAAEAGFISIMMVNNHGTSKWVAPPGGRDARLGTNPIACGIPNTDAPLILDFSTSAASEGNVRLRNIAGAACPPEWLLNSAGQSTTDPGVLYRQPTGTIRPMCSDQAHKGFGLALICEVLAGGLSGGVCSRESPVNQRGNCVFLQVMDPDFFCGSAQFSQTVEELLEYVRACPPTEAADQITLPGDRSRNYMQARTASGVPIDADNWSELIELAQELNVETPACVEDSYAAKHHQEYGDVLWSKY